MPGWNHSLARFAEVYQDLPDRGGVGDERDEADVALSGQVYPFLGLRDDHHSFSHSWQNKEFASITRFWIEQYAYLVRKLASSQEGDGTVLDHSCIMLANEQWAAHSAERVPLLMAGSLDGAWHTGRSLDFEQSSNRKFSSLLMTLSRHMGLSLDQFGDSSSALAV